MTRRCSLRAQAREIYRELAARKAAEATTDQLCPGSPPARGRTEGEAQSLTEKARALYEDSAVPVAEIARRVGVTERTLYKYARKGGWKPRYAWINTSINRDGAGRRRWRAGKDFAPIKGAGARFIRRADKGKPFAHGLKATDPAGAARAALSCGEAVLLSRQAQHEVGAEQRSQALIHAIEGTSSAFRNLYDFHQRRDKEPTPLDDRLEDILTRLVTMSLAQWQALVAEELAAKRAGQRVPIGKS